MDANKALSDIRRYVRDAGDEGGGTSNDHYDLTLTIDGLDQWLSKGGFPPDAWKPQPPKREPGYLGLAHRIEALNAELASIREELAALAEQPMELGRGLSGADKLAAETRATTLAEEAATVADSVRAARQVSPWRKPNGAFSNGPLQHAIRKVLYNRP